MGVDPYDNFRDLSIPVEPIGLDVSSEAVDDVSFIVSAHQILSGPAVGLSQNPWGKVCGPSSAGTEVGCPKFEYYLTGAVAPGPSEVVHVPAPKIIAATRTAHVKDPTQPAIDYQQGFLVTYNASAEVDLFRVNPDSASSPARPFLTRAGQASIAVNADGKDSRGIVIDPSERQQCEAACTLGDPGYLACLRACVDVPLRAFIANRAPASLLLGRVRTVVVDSDLGAGTGSGAYDYVEIYSQTSLSVGPSKVVLGKAILPDGKTPKTYVFVVTFDTQYIFMYDIEAQRIVQVIPTGPGPHAIAFDSCTTDCRPGEAPYAYLYVGHFTDSYLGWSIST